MDGLEYIEREQLLSLSMDEWKKMNQRARTTLGALFVAGDVNSDGVLSLVRGALCCVAVVQGFHTSLDDARPAGTSQDEFTAIVNHVDPFLTSREVTSLYRQSIERSISSAMTKEDFVEVAVAHGLLTYRAQQKRLHVPDADDPGLFHCLHT